MPATPKTFKQADLERAIRAARACDLPILRSEVTKDGRIILVHFDGAAAGIASNDNSAANEWDRYFDAQGKE
jgi:hypothetical protein